MIKKDGWKNLGQISNYINTSIDTFRDNMRTNTIKEAIERRPRRPFGKGSRDPEDLNEDARF
jgi:hypothetical protein